MSFEIISEERTNMECEYCKSDTFHIDRMEQQDGGEIYMLVACSKCFNRYKIVWKKPGG